MTTKDEIFQKCEPLKILIDGIPPESFRIPATAKFLKDKLKNRVDNVIALVSNGSPNALNTAVFILNWRIRRQLDSGERLSWLKEPIPPILRLIDEIIRDIQSLFTNTPPVAVITINDIDVGQYFGGAVNTPLKFDASTSWDEDGLIVSYEWDFGDGTPIITEMTISHTFTMMGTYRVLLTVTDNGTPAETSQDWVEVTIL